MRNVLRWDAENDPRNPGWVLESEGVAWSIHPDWSAMASDKTLTDEELYEMGYDTINWHQLPNREPLHIDRREVI